MLLQGSITLTVTLCLAAAATAQYYGPEYGASVDSDTHGADGGDSPDYSKYYNRDVSAPFIAGAGAEGGENAGSGFVAPLDFSGFFGGASFGLGSASSPQQTLRPAASQGFVDTSAGAFGFPGAATPAAFFKPSPSLAPEPAPGPSYVSQRVHPQKSTLPKTYPELEDLNKGGRTAGAYSSKEVVEEPEYRKPQAHLGPYIKYGPRPITYRARRSPRRRQQSSKSKPSQDSESYVNPFAEEVAGSHRYSSKPEEFDGDARYTAPSDAEFESPNFDDYFKEAASNSRVQDEPSLSERESERLRKTPGSCKKVEKDGLTCMVCADKKTGGNYEQCSYSSEPQEKRYSYVKEKKYNSNDQPQEEQEEGEEGEGTEPRRAEVRRTKSKAPGKKYTTTTPAYNQRRRGEERYQSQQPKASSTEDHQDLVDPVSRLFPQYTATPLQNRRAPRPSPEEFTADESKQDVDAVLAEFAKKDRSDCVKTTRDSMTCYKCVDAKGVQHEECMFVSESRPKASHLAYHEVKQYKQDPEGPAEEASATEVTKARQPRRKTNLPLERTRREAVESKEAPEVNGEASHEDKSYPSPDGAFASELVPRYSKKLGVTLPEFMLHVSEHEKAFEESAKSG